MQLTYILGLLGGFLSFVAYIPYWYSIFYKGARPQRATWLIWIFSDFLILFASWKLGATDGIWVLLVYFICTIITFFISIGKGEGGAHWFDMVCFLSTLLSAFIWYKTGSPFMSLVLNLSIVVIGVAPTIIKIIKDPYSEDLFAFVFWLLGSISALFSVVLSDNVKFDLILPSVVFIVLQLLVSTLIIFGRVRRKFSSS